MSNSDDTDDEGLVQAFSQAAMLMDVLLEFHTGLSPFDRKLLTYYTLGIPGQGGHDSGIIPVSIPK